MPRETNAELSVVASPGGCVAAVVSCLVVVGILAGVTVLLFRDHTGAALAVLGGLVAIGFGFWIRQPKRWIPLKRKLGLAPGMGKLAARLGLEEEDLRRARPRYHEVQIPKKRGGFRVLQVPDDQTKALQRRILHRLLARMPVHDAAYGFTRGRSIAHHAAQHVGRAIVLRYDVVDFFPETRSERIHRMFLRFGWDHEAAQVLTDLVTYRRGLPQGAPTSPMLSNVVNRGLDRELSRQIGEKHGRYTRYADDVTVSFPEDWIGTPEKTRAAVRRAFALRGYRLHGREKSWVRRRHERQVVNGLVVNEKVALPRKLRRRLRAARHHLATGREATWTEEQLQGWAAFERMVEDQGAEVPPPFERRGKPPRSSRYRP